MKDDALHQAWRDNRAGREPSDEGRAAMREHDRELNKETARPRITAGAFAALEKYAKKLGVSAGAFLDQLIQRAVAGEIIELREHAIEVKKRDARILELEDDVDRMEARKDTEKAEARAARAQTAETVDAWLRSIDKTVSDLDALGVAELSLADFQCLGENDTTEEGPGKAAG